jgi:shikimate kinase
MMGTGKTTVGRRLAATLHRRFFDSDAEVEAKTGRTVREIFETDGEAAYRPLETAALLDALADREPSVIAAAGGVVLNPANRAALRDGNTRVIWLRADPSVLAARALVGGQGHRPLLDRDAAAALARLAAEREPFYREVADEIIDVDHLNPDAVVKAILA